MAYSMTGFGRGSKSLSDKECTVEIKSVNSKYCDINIRLPKALNGVENDIKKIISSRLRRGKIDAFINYEDLSEESKEVVIDTALVKAYQQALNEINKELKTNEKIKATTIASYNDVLKVRTKKVDDEKIWELVEQALLESLDQIDKMRSTEGQLLVEDILDKVSTLQGFHDRIRVRSPLVVDEFALRLKNRINDLAKDLVQEKIDEQRLAQEIALFSDKCSIDEEIIRLNSHIKQLHGMLKEEGTIGKKIDFLIQEINRETNTIGSKANDLAITQYVVEMKNTIEKIREQVQNLE